MVYNTPITSEDDMMARFSVAAGNVRDIPDVFTNVRQSMCRRCESFITVGGHSFELLL